MSSPHATRDPLEGLKFTFRSDEAHSPPVEVELPDQETPAAPPGETPLTDPRSLGSSALVHVLLILLASFTAMSVALPRTDEGPSALRELDPVDNRADAGKTRGQGGGSPGEIGGLGSVAFAAPRQATTPARGPDLAVDALLHEILPSTVQKPSESVPRAPPGPQTTGVGLIPGSAPAGAAARGAAPAAGRPRRRAGDRVLRGQGDG
ncbi:MAG: hypothetical protein U0790_08935 [Isosphaeraceae bacterium]